MATQQELSLQMLAQLRLLDPSMSGEIGTPERKIIDTVGQALYESQIDLDALNAGLDLDSKYGAQLDRFLSIFGFARQKATYAQGFVTFSRVTPANVDIRIPSNSRVAAPALVAGDPDAGTQEAIFYTLYDAALPAGETSVVVPVRAVLAGALGNVGADRITELGVGSPIFGVTAVTNEAPTIGGKGAESDEEYKVRFKNTVFRNLAGTQDQYLALAVASAFATRANVIGPWSVYREYVQVPPVDDASSYDVNSDSVPDTGLGGVGDYTTAQSTNPYAKHIYATELPSFVSNGRVGVGAVFYRQDVDFVLNVDAAAKNRGDTARLASAGLDALDSDRPNVTFKNVYTGANANVQAIRPGDVVLLEYSYMSDASRNDFKNKITNAVDVFVDGGEEALGSMVTVRPTTGTAFVDDPTSKFHYENYRRVGDPGKRPLIGNVLMPLFWQPIIDVPDQITVGTTAYYRGVHYWPVQDVSGLGGTIRARDGIEWSTKVFGKAQGDTQGDPATYTGPLIIDNSGDPVGGQAIEINNYSYDKAIIDLQVALQGARQITTDALAHRARRRYFKLDVTIMYSPGTSVADVNQQIHDAVDSFLRSQYFGSAIQLSDILQVIHGVPGVDNVRWTADLPLITGAAPTGKTPRVIETTAGGQPLLNVFADRVQPGSASRPEIQGLYIVGEPAAGYFRLSWNNQPTADLAYNSTATDIQNALTALTGIGDLTVVEDTRSTVGVRSPIRSFRVTWGSNGAKSAISALPPVSQPVMSGGPFSIRNDFFLRDDELAQLAEAAYTPASGIPDAVAGLILRPRAQNTWIRSQ